MRRANLGELREDGVFEAGNFLYGYQLPSWVLQLDLRLCQRTGTASMTKSTSPRSSILVVVVKRCLVELACSCVMRCLPTSFSRSLSVPHPHISHLFPGLHNPRTPIPANFNPLSSDACELSTTVTGTPALSAAISAIPRP